MPDIQYDNSNKATVSGASSLTFSHTTSSSNNRILLVGGYWAADRTVSSLTYAGVAMSTAVTTLLPGATEVFAVYKLTAPTTGTNNVVITLSGSTDIAGVSGSWINVGQTDTVEATRTETNLETGTLYSEAITTLSDNAYVVWFTREYAGRTITAGANTALRQRENTIYGLVLADSSTVIANAGNSTLTLNSNLSGNWYCDVLVSLKPMPTFTTTETATLTESYPQLARGQFTTQEEITTLDETITSKAPGEAWTGTPKSSTTFTNQNKS